MMKSLKFKHRERMMGYQIHRKVKVKGGHEITATLTDGEIARTKLFFCLGDDEPTDKSLADKLTAMVERFTEKNLIVPDVSMMKSEVEELLVAKGYLTAEQTLDDLPDKEG